VAISNHFQRVAKYSVYDSAYPERVDQAYVTFALAVRDAAITSAPSTLSELAIVLPRGWYRRQRALDVVVLGSFRRPPRVILQVARLLAPIYLESGILPIVQPVVTREWLKAEETESEPFARVRERGILAFTRALQ